ncbi:MAG: cupin domain-containing protein [Rikenellaceae bacterium]
MTPKSANFLHSNSLEWETPAPGLKRQIMGYNTDVMMVKILFDEGAIGSVHAHPHTQTTYVVEGKFEVEINGKKEILSQGDGFFVDPNTDHGVKCIEAGALIDVFSPMRADFL